MITKLINENLIALDLKAQSKEEVFNELIETLSAQGRISDKEQILADINAREELGNTGFEEGVALPHAKSAAVIEPAVVIGVHKTGIDYGAEDGLPSKLFFMIASPDGGDNHHIEVLAELSSKLIEPGFIEQFLNAPDNHAALQLLLTKQPETESSPAATKGLIIGVTGCPAGVAHTYLAAEALENYHYQSLLADVTLDTAGELQLALQLKGNNPQFQAGRPIHLNITITENIPALIKSLRLTSEIAQSFGK